MQDVQVSPCCPRSAISTCSDDRPRQELAAREHMLDHGQLGPATPARSPAVSRRPAGLPSRCDSANQGRPRHPSHMLSDSLLMSTVKPDGPTAGGGDSPKSASSAPLRCSSSTGEGPVVGMSHHADDDHALEDGSDEDEPSYSDSARILDEAARILGRRMSDAVRSGSRQASSENVAGLGNDTPSETTVISPDLVSEPDVNPKLAGLRTVSSSKLSLSISAPILANPKCSGYFVEPVSCLFFWCPCPYPYHFVR